MNTLNTKGKNVEIRHTIFKTKGHLLTTVTPYTTLRVKWNLIHRRLSRESRGVEFFGRPFPSCLVGTSLLSMTSKPPLSRSYRRQCITSFPSYTKFESTWWPLRELWDNGLNLPITHSRYLCRSLSAPLVSEFRSQRYQFDDSSTLHEGSSLLLALQILPVVLLINTRIWIDVN